jgi:hypothetical protein
MTIERAAATASDTLDNTSGDQLINGLTLTPAANDYALLSTVQVDTDASAGTERTTFVVYVGSTRVDHSERLYDEDTSIDNTTLTYMLSCVVSPNGSEAVQIRHNTSGSGSPLVATNREMNLFPITGTELEQTATGDTTVGDGTFVTLGSMSFTTPASGNRLLMFTTSVEGPTGSECTFRVQVGGSTIQHTERINFYESSAFDGRWMMAIICEINPTGSQDVVIQWASTAGSDTMTCGARTLTLIPTDAGDIFEASGTADDADSTTTDKQIDDMAIITPGVADFMVAFTSTQFWGSISSPAGLATYRIRSGGATVTDSARGNENENSLDSSDISTRAGGLRVTNADISDSLRVYWQGATSDQRTCRERTFVAIREPTAAFAAAIRGRMAIRARSDAAKTYTGIGHVRLPSRSAAAAQKTYIAQTQARLALSSVTGTDKTTSSVAVASLGLRSRLDGIRAFIASLVARIALGSRSATDKAADGTTRDSIALRGLSSTGTVRGGTSTARLALRSLDTGAKTSAGIAIERLALRSFTTAQKTFDAVGVANFAMSTTSAGQKTAVGIGAESFAIRVTSDGTAIFAAAFPYHVIKENDRDMRAMLTL